MNNVTLIGMGRVGSHILRAFTHNNIPVREVFTRPTPERIELANKCDTPIVSDWAEIDKTSDIFIIAVPDQSIGDVAEKLHTQIEGSPLVVHTSGTTPLKELSQYFEHYGLWYPLQSFSLNSEVDWSELPVFIEAGIKEDLPRLEELGKAVNARVIKIDEEQRPHLHLAAVIANNFPNALFNWAKQVLDSNNMEFEYIKPLIRDGLNKSLEIGPEDAQTGPAERGDKSTIERHLELLQNDKAKKELYLMLSKLINPNIEL